jgi:DNA primase
VGRIPEATIQAIRDRIDLADLVGRYVSLKRAGRNWKGLCPFHEEKTPSFNVHPERQIFHCFGCGAGGDAFRFLVLREGLAFPEAVRSLAAEVGIEVPEEDRRGEAGVLEQLRNLNAIAQRFYRERLGSAEGEAARAYLCERGIDAAASEAAEIGFAPDRWEGVARALAQAGVSGALGEQAGLLVARPSGGAYDRLRGRVTFPIRDARGRILGFAGRALRSDQEPKYLNTPETPLFSKRRSLYGLPHALEPIRRSGRAIVVEGYFDRMALDRAGLAEGVATCGTALTSDHARELRKRTSEVVLFFDGDEAGERAMLRALEVLLPEDLRVRAAVLPPGDDPDSLLVREGAEALRARVDAALPALEIAIARAVARGRATAWQKADAVAAVAPLLAAVSNPVERGELVRRLALAADVDPRAAAVAVAAAARGGEPAARDAVPAPVRVAGPEDRYSRAIACALLAHPNLADGLDAVELDALVADSPLREVLGTLVTVGTDRAAIDVAALAESLPDAPRQQLIALAADEHPPLDREGARGAIADALARLRRRRSNAEDKALTERLRSSEADAESLLAAKQRRIEEKRLGLAGASEIRSMRP